ncbi:hypothetical protein A3J44_06150 [candidate division WOR-1 bacterium RIFCSPHIGHO2_02_FULL_45_12]|nr:MAG: hypothetical protein A3J44_06150 [candidate division WOR-1 bacterium RIFCSPHIGHO2_02_FULL_45_12]
MPRIERAAFLYRGRLGSIPSSPTSLRKELRLAFGQLSKERLSAIALATAGHESDIINPPLISFK